MTAPAGGFRTFGILWFGQFVSLTGSALSSFALGVYVYQLTGSVTTLGLVYALGMLPSILASPLAGSLVDRWGTRRALLASNVSAMLAVLSLALLVVAGAFAVWHVYVVVVALSVIRSVQVPAFLAAVPLMVPKRHLGRANGMRVFAMAVSQVLAPVAAGFLLLAIDVYGILLLDVVSFGLAILTLFAIRIPRAGRVDEATTAGVRKLLSDFMQAWAYVRLRRGLLALLLFIAALNFSAGFVDVLIIPLVLAFAPTNALGAVLSIGGIGMIAASLAMSAWGGPRRRIRGILGFSMMLAVATVIGSVRPNVALVAVAAFLFLGSLAIIISSNQYIWQTKVEAHLLGRVMALQNMVANAPQFLAYALAGPVADRVFSPLVGRDHVDSPVLATVVGDGPGRGVALLLMVIGLLIAVSVVLAAMNPRLRHLEHELPDVTTDERGAVAERAAAPA